MPGHRSDQWSLRTCGQPWPADRAPFSHGLPENGDVLGRHASQCSNVNRKKGTCRVSVWETATCFPAFIAPPRPRKAGSADRPWPAGRNNDRRLPAPLPVFESAFTTSVAIRVTVYSIKAHPLSPVTAFTRIVRAVAGSRGRFGCGSGRVGPSNNEGAGGGETDTMWVTCRTARSFHKVDSCRFVN